MGEGSLKHARDPAAQSAAQVEVAGRLSSGHVRPTLRDRIPAESSSAAGARARDFFRRMFT